jgi:hypothetical protein
MLSGGHLGASFSSAQLFPYGDPMNLHQWRNRFMVYGWFLWIIEGYQNALCTGQITVCGFTTHGDQYRDQKDGSEE